MTFKLHLRGIELLIFIGEEFERENPALENRLILAPTSSTLETQQRVPEVNDHNHVEDIQLIARATAVGVQYEFAQHGVVETADDRRKRKRRNQRRVLDEEKRLREVVGDLPPPSGSSQM